MTVTVEIVGVPVACGDRVKHSWREIAAWVSRELDRAFDGAVRVQYHDFFEVGCPALPADAKLPIVLIDGEPITVGEKISLPLIRKTLVNRGVAMAAVLQRLRPNTVSDSPDVVAGGKAMANSNELIITLDGRRRVTAHIGGHEIRTDQPVSNGGEDSAPSPFDVFLASLGTCAGIFVQGFCATRGIDTSGIRIHEWPHYDAQGTLKSVELAIDLPVDFPVRYREPLLRVIEQCSVKRAITAKPEFQVGISGTPEAAAVAAHHAIST